MGGPNVTFTKQTKQNKLNSLIDKSLKVVTFNVFLLFFVIIKIEKWPKNEYVKSLRIVEHSLLPINWFLGQILI